MAEKTDAVPTPEKAASPTTPEQSLEIAKSAPVRCRCAVTGAEIVVDAEEKAIQFYYCHVPRKFFTLGGATEYAVCRFDEIEAYYVYRPHQKSGRAKLLCKIVTTSGTATVNEDGIGFNELRSWLDENVVSRPAAHPADIPGLVYGIAGVVTILAMLAYLLWPADSVLANPKFIGMMVLLFVGMAVVYFCRLVSFRAGSKGRT
jgi:hypothetical protein